MKTNKNKTNIELLPSETRISEVIPRRYGMRKIYNVQFTIHNIVDDTYETKNEKVMAQSAVHALSFVFQYNVDKKISYVTEFNVFVVGQGD